MIDNIASIRNQFVQKYTADEFRILYKGTDKEVKTIELQGAHFVADEDFIIRKPNYDYAKREIEWYKSQSLNVNDIPGETPTIWKAVSDKNGMINSNYGWVIYSPQNFLQYENCINTLVNDQHSRQAVMIYNRPSMQYECRLNGMSDFMCTFSVQTFINERDGKKYIDYFVNQRSLDAVFGYNNDYQWHKYVLENMAKDLSERLNEEILPGKITWNAGSIHIYERHFKFLENYVQA